ncbi:MAG: MBOAT family O-acyltransferase [Myxococcota bacterium]|nr:MBOAT family O-acyltransferase [Myxococcota bacterium]
MNFIQNEFVYFFIIVLVVYWTLRNRRYQNLLLMVCSGIFYGWVHPWFLLLLYGSALTDYFVGLGMEKYPQRRKALLIVSLCVNLGMLGTFKYFDFFIENVIAAFGAMGMETSLHTLGIFLPVGISFYTFQTMSYTIEVYRGRLQPRQNFSDYIVFVSFFPQLVAGPVERATHLLPQVEKERVWNRQRFVSGLTLALWGGAKKVMVADTIAPYVDKIYLLDEPSGPMIWAATIGFSIQILADFSGYTDIARGTARMLGFELMENFKHPYLAVNPSDFWRRWHVSFSTWIRDYLYIPLGGSRGGFWGTIRATFGAMLLSGLWHGASWNFVLWGAYHAALSTGYRQVAPRIPKKIKESPVGWPLAVVIMYMFSVIGWMIFRETNFSRLIGYWSQNPFHATPDQWVATTVMLGMCLFASIPLVLALFVQRWFPNVRQPWRLPIQTTGWALCIVLMFLFVRMHLNDFIYFQF